MFLLFWPVKVFEIGESCKKLLFLEIY